MFADVVAIAAAAVLAGSIAPLVNRLVRGRNRDDSGDDTVTFVYEADGEKRTISVDPNNEQQIRDLLKVLQGKGETRAAADAPR